LDNEFWQFSFWELGKYDFPAFVDYVREQTGQEKITYVAHSMGTTNLFVGLDQDEEFYGKRLNGCIALCPVAILKGTKSNFLRMISKNTAKIWENLSADGLHELYGKDWFGETGQKVKSHVK
jgi:pimeloyl-ACP methyl ester carboxylesterase